MSVAMTVNTNISPLRNAQSGIVAFFRGYATGTGDGSGGSINATFTLSGQEVDPTLNYILTAVNWTVTNTGVAYIGGWYTNASGLTMMQDEQTSYIGHNESLVDNGSWCGKMITGAWYLGHKFSDIESELKTIIMPNTNTKTYTAFVQGYVFKGVPFVSQGGMYI